MENFEAHRGPLLCAPGIPADGSSVDFILMLCRVGKGVCSTAELYPQPDHSLVNYSQPVCSAVPISPFPVRILRVRELKDAQGHTGLAAYPVPCILVGHLWPLGGVQEFGKGVNTQKAVWFSAELSGVVSRTKRSLKGPGDTKFIDRL